jgi:hypothetical protein
MAQEAHALSQAEGPDPLLDHRALRSIPGNRPGPFPLSGENIQHAQNVLSREKTQTTQQDRFPTSALPTFLPPLSFCGEKVIVYHITSHEAPLSRQPKLSQIPNVGRAADERCLEPSDQKALDPHPTLRLAPVDGLAV